MNTDQPGGAQQALHLAEQYQQQGKLAEAEALLRQAIHEDPGCHSAYHSLGLLAHKVGKSQLARELIEHAIELDGGIALYHNNLCEILRRLGSLGRAAIAGKKATQLMPDNPHAWYNLGLVRADAGDWQQAETAYKHVIELKPDHDQAINNLGTVYEGMDRQDEALAAYTRAIEINPENAEAQNNAGAIFSELGNLDAARKTFEKAIETSPEFIEPHYNLSSLKTYVPGDPHLVNLLALRARVPDLPQDMQTRYYFSVGKALEDTQKFDESFEAYKRGNDLKFPQMKYNPADTSATVQRIKEVFSSELFGTRKSSGRDDATPVFIVGMPRSGSTLIEQILSSHDEVFGAGELTDLHEVVSGALADEPGSNPLRHLEPGLPGIDFSKLAASYVYRVRKLDIDAARITDKMPANFFHIGFIHLMFPNARIIHSMRDPMDSCFSCFTRLFNQTMEFAYNLETLSHYYRQYVELMDHWHRVLPEGTILDVRYEEVVDNLEPQSRQMIDYLGLDWDPKCIDFHKNTRPVNTASVAQVRKPIYSSSVGRWKNFRHQLEPLERLIHGDESTPTPGVIQ